VAPETAEPQGPEFDFLTWFEVNKKLLSLLLTIVIVAVVASMFLRYRKDAAEAEANKALIAVSGGTAPATSAAYLEVAQYALRHPRCGTRESARRIPAVHRGQVCRIARAVRPYRVRLPRQPDGSDRTARSPPDASAPKARLKTPWPPTSA
jgi:cbb3-type cytochrome oxidase subunit 3